MGDDEVKAWNALKRAILGGELCSALEVWGNVSLDMPMRIAGGSARLDIARIGDVAKFPESLAFCLAFLASD